MSEHDLEKLFGGFATDTLTAQERDTLFRAALQDQQLFNALANEQALKELLADPSVRRRLLQSLAQRREASRWQSWLKQFMQPAGLAWAGGVAVGVFAVILGINIYQDSLRQASETVVLEETRPSAPTTVPPARTPKEDREIVEPRKAAPIPEPAVQDQAASQTGREKSVERDKKHTSSKEEQKSQAPVAASAKSAGDPTTLRELPAPPASPSSALSVHPLKEIPGAASGTSARSLFYADVSSPPEENVGAHSKQARPSQAPKQFALTKGALDRTAPGRPLALRYAFVIRSEEAAEREVTAAAAASETGPVVFRIETNQETYVQIWASAGELLPELLLPSKETGRISLKTAGGQRQAIVVPPERDRLTVRVARSPFGPITRQEVVMAGRAVGEQLTEHTSGKDEEATYVANPDPSAQELAVDVAVETIR